MEFPVKDDAGLARLHPGQHIRATVFQDDSDLSYWLGDIQDAAAPAPSP